MRLRRFHGIGNVAACFSAGLVIVAGLATQGAGQSTAKPKPPAATQPKANPSQLPRTGAATRPKQLVRTKDPEAAAVLVNLVARFADDVKDKTDLDRRVQKALSGDPRSREVARRMMASLRRASVAKRQAVLGKWADTATTEKFTQADAQRAFARLAKYKPAVVGVEEPPSATPGAQLKHRRFEDVSDERQEVRPGPDERRPFNEWIPKGKTWFPERDAERRSPLRGLLPVVSAQDQPNRYQLYYNGMWCRYETDDDHGTDSDEVYAIVTIAETSGTSTTFRVPARHDPRYYYDLDDGDHRPKSGNIRRVWGGSRGRTARDLSVAVWMYEQDSGDPEEREEAIRLAWTTAGAICGATIEAGLVPCIVSILGAALIQGIVAIVTGGDDDPVGEVITANVTADQMRRWVDGGLRTWRRGDIPAHFRTIHIGAGDSEGADYRMYFAFHIPLDAY